MCIKSRPSAKPMLTFGIENGLNKDNINNTIESILKFLNPLFENFSNKKKTKAAIKVGTMLDINTGTMERGLVASIKMVSVKMPAALSIKNKMAFEAAAAKAAKRPALSDCPKFNFVCILVVFKLYV